ncbi:sigma-70 family RNA polymerase sigma factor [Microbispora sp. ZYX-F-249]|uniref:Sigma-70 family RNA polymerase sigma factor n=1 Tax=Microbispora maris TaxID=3144104 RepID=A0ABV0B1S6_9ACTN
MDDPEERFTELYDRHYRNVLGYALLRAERQSAEDIASETFLIAWRRLAQVPEHPLPWLLAVARNLLRKQHRLDMRRLRLTASAPEGDVADQVSERQTAIDALARLSGADAEALILASWYGLGPAEAAKVVGCSARTFAVRLHRARRRLADILNAPQTVLQEQLR